MKKIYYCLSVLFLSATPLVEAKFYAEAGVSYFALHGAHFEKDLGQASNGRAASSNEISAAGSNSTGINANGISSIGIASAGFICDGFGGLRDLPDNGFGVIGITPASSIVPGATPLTAFTSTPRLAGEDKSKFTPFVAVGYSFSDRLGLRLSYHYVSNLNARAKAFSLVGGDALAENIFYTFKDDVHLLSLSPEFKLPLTDKLVMTFSPELNWVANRGEVLLTTTNPALEVVPRWEHNDQGFTLGASIGLGWAWTERCALEVRYKYADLKPSRGREANIVSSAVRWTF
jgi:hypothetical protein